MENYGIRVAKTCDRIKELMAERNIKQTDIAIGTGFKKGTISRYVSGKSEPKSDMIVPLAKFFGVDPVWLWGFDVPKERNASKERNMRAAQITTRMRNDEEFLLLVEQLNALPADQLTLIKGIVRGFVGNKDTKDEV